MTATIINPQLGIAVSGELMTDADPALVTELCKLAESTVCKSAYSRAARLLHEKVLGLGGSVWQIASDAVKTGHRGRGSKVIVWPEGLTDEERAEIERLGTLIAGAARSADTSVLRGLLAHRLAELGVAVPDPDTPLPTKSNGEETPDPKEKAAKSLSPRERLRELL